jgi:hypothetical protein
MDARLDKFGTLVSQSKVAIAILGTPALDRFELAELESISTDRLALLGLELVAILGLIPDKASPTGFTPRVVLAVELDTATEAVLTDRLARLMQRFIARIQKAYLPTLRMEAN